MAGYHSPEYQSNSTKFAQAFNTLFKTAHVLVVKVSVSTKKYESSSVFVESNDLPPTLTLGHDVNKTGRCI